MDETQGPLSWLFGKSPTTFGALGSGGTGIGSNAGVNNGMPMSGLGAGPGAVINNGMPMSTAGSAGLGMLPGLLSRFMPGGAPGSAPAGNNGSAPGTQRSANPALGIAQQFLQQPQITPATFNWNMLQR